MQTVSVRLRAITSGWNSAMRSAASSMGGLQRNADKLTRIGGVMSATVTPAILGVGAAVVGVGMKFESAMSGVEAVTGAGEEAMASMSAQAQELGRTTQFSASEAAGALEFLGMAGFSAQEATEALPDTLSLAAAGGLELANAADLASNVLQQFALDVEETGRVADVLAQTATNSNTSVEQLGQAMQMAGPVANAAGLELEETAAAIGAMGNAGIQASQAGTSLRGAMTRLLNASGPAAEVIAELGINAENADGTLRPLPDIIDQLADSGATAGEMMEIFGQRAGPAMAALVQQGGDALRDLTGTIEDSAGAAEEMADVRMDNLSGDLKELQSAAEGAGIALYEAGIGDALRGVADGATSALQGIAGLPDPVLRTGAGLGAVAAAAGPAITAIGMIANKAPTIAANFRRGRQALSGRAGMAGALVATAVAADQLGESLGRAIGTIRDDLDIDAITADLESLRIGMQDVADMSDLEEMFPGDFLQQGPGGLAGAIERVANPSVWNRIADVTDSAADAVSTVGGIFGDIDGAKDLQLSVQGIEALDESLQNIAASDGAPAAVEALEALAAAEGLSADQLEQLKQLLPGFRTELQGATNDANNAGVALGDYLPSSAEQAEDGLMGLRGTAETAADAMGDTIPPGDGMAGMLDGVGESAEEAASNIERYLDTVQRATDPVYALNSALEDVDDAQQSYNEAVDEYGRNSPQAEQAAFNLASAVSDAEQAALDGDLSFDAFDKKLQQWVDQGEITAGQANNIRDRVKDLRGEAENYAGNYDAWLAVHANTAEQRLSALSRMLERLTGRTWNVRVSTVGGVRGVVAGNIPEFHSGGNVTASLPRTPGLAADERLITAQVGETVVPAGAVMAPAGGGGGATVHHTTVLTLDGRRIGESEAVFDGLSGQIARRSRRTGGVGL